MNRPHVIPGSFPTEQPLAQMLQATSTQTPSSAYDNMAEMTLDDALQILFASNELARLKTAAQKHLIGQLDAFTYFIIGFQFLKYTHGSCMPPTVAHFLVQFLLYASHFTATGPGSGRQIFADQLTSQERHFQAAGLSFDRHRIIGFIVSKTRNVILWKFLACVAYHVLLVVFYFQPVANDGRLHLLENGSWYFVSFVGEILPQDYSANDPWWLRLWKLGFCGLLFMDAVILILQLIIYQSIFLQSTISPKGLRLNEPEQYILRALGIGTGGDDISLQWGVPDIFHVKLYESLGDDPMAELNT